MTTRFRPALTTDELTAIRKRHPSSMDTLALLWEIKRLRSVLLRMDQLARSQMPWGGVLDGLWKQLKTDLTDEPCVRDQARLTRSLLDPERKNEESIRAMARTAPSPNDDSHKSRTGLEPNPAPKAATHRSPGDPKAELE